MSLHVISDLHICSPDDSLYPSLLTLMRETAVPGDTLVLAGDIFDVFVGNKRIFINRYREFVKELKATTARGVRVHYIEGNHDFLLRRAFRKIPGFTRHPRDMSVEIHGKRFFIAHGDTINRKDYRYLALRAFFRSPVMRGLIRTLPGKLWDEIGKASSSFSRGKRNYHSGVHSHGELEKLRRIFRSFAAERLAQGYDFVVIGHCHDLDEMQFNIGGRSCQYINVGYPRAHGSFLSWSPGDEKIHREPLPAKNG